MFAGLLVATSLFACSRIPEANESLADAAVTFFAEFDEEETRVASVILNLEREAYRGLDVDTENARDRAVSAGTLSEEDIDHLAEHPDRDPRQNLSVLMAYASSFPVSQHARIPVLKDQRPLEPGSPEHFDREFLSDRTCWEDRGCEWLATRQDLTKVYPSPIIPQITYQFDKDFRWVNLAKSGLDAPRWGFIARSHTRREFATENGNNEILQSYTFEVWIPRDGEGFVWADGPPEDRPDAGDSTGGGTLRLYVVWTEASILGVKDPAIQENAIRGGMNDNVLAHDDWLTAHPD